MSLNWHKALKLNGPKTNILRSLVLRTTIKVVYQEVKLLNSLLGDLFVHTG